MKPVNTEGLELKYLNHIAGTAQVTQRFSVVTGCHRMFPFRLL